jgi:hypothetical protein
MSASSFNRVLAVVPMLSLAACATAPSHINDVCAVFDQRDGWFNNWQSSARSAEAKYGVPVPVLMATIRKESGFKGRAKPPRTKLLGFIPWKRPSSAYGYSQALDGTWSQYKMESGNWGARRSSFADAVDFVGWYHSKTAENYGVAKNDTFHLYLAYYLGWGGYKRGNWPESVQNYAKATDDMARKYAAQLQGCSG